MSLYLPAHFTEADANAEAAMISELIAAAPFATLISARAEDTLISHIPIIEDAQGWLLAHVAQANPQRHALHDGAEATAVFHGPHVYISPSCYDTPGVPTWNYVVAHIHARVHVQTGEEAQQALDALIAAFDDPAAPGHATREARARLLQHIHCFRLEPLRVEAKFKLSQNRTPTEQQRIIAQLSQQDDEASHAVASLMLRRLVSARGIGSA